MIRLLRIIFKIKTKFCTYRHQKITIKLLFTWLNQFPRHLHKYLLDLLNKVIYLTEDDAKESLIELNNNITKQLSADKISPDKIIYIQIDDAGSSSPVMLNLLRDSANLSRKGSILIDSKDTDALHKITSEMGFGAIVYVDDFSGSGRQFLRNRKWISNFIVGSFAEFFLVSCICEEAFYSIKDTGVEPVYSILHFKKERPLHPESNFFNDNIKKELVDISRNFNNEYPLGFQNMATMVVFYRNSPNSMPLILRGSLGQNPYIGIFPRHDDLPYLIYNLQLSR